MAILTQLPDDKAKSWRWISGKAGPFLTLSLQLPADKKAKVWHWLTGAEGTLEGKAERVEVESVRSKQGIFLVIRHGNLAGYGKTRDEWETNGASLFRKIWRFEFALAKSKKKAT